MKICVTGGLGFIGSHIVDVLVEQNHQVLVIDNERNGSKKNLNPKAIYEKVDVTDRKALDQCFQVHKPQAVCHQAAQINVTISMDKPSFDAHENIMGTITVLDMCIKHHCERLVFASSAAVYGNPKYLGIDEQHPVDPLSYYGLSKLTAEKYIQLYGNQHDLTFGILRYANVYGPRQKADGEGGVVAIFSERMKEKKRCIIEGDGDQTRDFIYVKDVATANAVALQSRENLIVNVSTNEEVSINGLYENMKVIHQYKKEPIKKPKRAGDITQSYLDNQAIQNILKWQPKYHLVEGLQDML